jgi:hypothetical protein
VPYVPLFDGSYKNSTALLECEQYPYELHLDYSPAYLFYRECPDEMVWMTAVADCVPIATTGCRM